MGKETIQLTTDKQGYSTCEVPITKEQWLEMLYNNRIFGPERTRVVLSFYFMPERKASCTQCVERYGYNYSVFNRGISSLGQNVVRKLGTFSVLDENGKECFWPVAMGKGRFEVANGSQQFVWQLRQELAEAVEEFLLEDAIEQYLADFDNHWRQELYKWRAVQWFQENWNRDAEDFAKMFEDATAKTANLLASMSSYPRGMIIAMAQASPEEVRSMFVNLFDESQDLVKRANDFLQKAEEVKRKYDPGNWNSHFQSTNSISTYLWLRYPEKYSIYKYGEVKEVASKLGLSYAIKRRQTASMVEGLKVFDWLSRRLKTNPKVVEFLKSHLEGSKELHPDPEFRTAAIDLDFWISRYYQSKEHLLHQSPTTHMSEIVKVASDLLKSKKNLIIQGAPGTGKTYHTAEIAVYMVDGKLPGDHAAVMERYEQLRRENRIGFTTFHQSMDYEDFIEGIKPMHMEGKVVYTVEDGIFKRLCQAAQVASEITQSGADNLLNGVNENPTIWKISLKYTGDNPIRKDCMDNNYIRIGWDEYGDLDFSEDNPDVTEGKSILRQFQNEMRIGDIVVSCWSQDETDAIGIITGDYEYREEGGELPRYREVRWIVKGIKHNIKEINNGKHMSAPTVYRLDIAFKDILSIVEQYAPTKQMSIERVEKPYVLIIDEINRGNVSKIFGEIITLLEKDKRLGAEHPLTLSLPYSSKDKSDFGVPQNLYVIGTMNTTDRSTGTIDYAIRRRFAFLTLPANRDYIRDAVAKALFDNVREFIQRYKYADLDIEDLMVGHSYFMAGDDDELQMKMKYEVIPLIREYIKDGILSVRLDEAQRFFDSWLKLETVNDSDNGTSED